MRRVISKRLHAAVTLLCAAAFATGLHAREAAATPEPEYSEAKVTALIAALPTPAEKDQWAAYFNMPIAQRPKLDVALTRKMKNISERFLQLYALVKPGKSIFDYPGILAPWGGLRWDGRLRTYTFTIQKIGSPSVEERFALDLNEAGVITLKSLSLHHAVRKLPPSPLGVSLRSASDLRFQI